MMLSPGNEKALEKISKAKAHAVLVYGSYGAGFRIAVNYLMEQKNIKLINRLTVEGELGKDISIDQIRKLYELTRSSRNETVAVVIYDAHTLGDAAQNAFLKLLEEPPRNTYFILTSHRKDKLLPTIQSRLAAVELRPLSKTLSQRYANELSSDKTKISQVLFMAQGMADEIKYLFEDENYFSQQQQIIVKAKQFIVSKPYERFVILKDIKDRAQAAMFTRAIIQLMTYVIYNDAQKNKDSSYEIVANTLDKLEANANHRLSLAQMAIKL